MLSRVLYLGREWFPGGADHRTPSLNEFAYYKLNEFAYYNRNEGGDNDDVQLPVAAGIVDGIDRS